MNRQLHGGVLVSREADHSYHSPIHEPTLDSYRSSGGHDDSSSVSPIQHLNKYRDLMLHDYHLRNDDLEGKLPSLPMKAS